MLMGSDMFSNLLRKITQMHNLKIPLRCPAVQLPSKPQAACLAHSLDDLRVLVLGLLRLLSLG